MTRGSRPTIMDVARLADVSKTTVSYVINGAGYVSDERRARIEHAIARLGYRPNAFARGLSSQRLSTLGVISADAADPFVARVTSGIIAEAAARDILVTLAAHEVWSLSTGSPRPGRHPSDALIYIAGREFSPEVYAALAAQHLVVLAGEAGPGVGVAAVTVDPRQAARQLAVMVASSGHQRVAIAASNEPRWSLSERVTGLREGLASAGIAPEQVTTVAVDVSVNGGRMAVDQLFGDGSTRSGRPTAVLCVDDSVALGVLQQCRRIALAVPDDVSVTGFGDTPISRATTPALTTARLPAERVGRAAVEMLVRRGDMSPEAISARTIPAAIVAGDSISAPAARSSPDLPGAYPPH